jgi:ribonuclease E
VTSFLLNEKRTEITKIELKQRVTVLLVPNRHLETPNYKLERLRHDDPRLENIQASYTMVEEVEEDVGITRREKNVKPKQEPVIKGVLPDQPAPVAPPKPALAPAPVAAAPVAAPVAAPAPKPASGGFFGWLKSLFSAPEPFTAQPAPAQVVAPVAPAEGEGRDGKGGRGRRDGRRGEGRGERGEARGEGRGEGRGDRGSRNGPRGERTERPLAEGESREERSGRGRRPARDERAGVEVAGGVNAEAAREANREGGRDGGRRRRGPREEGAEGANETPDTNLPKGQAVEAGAVDEAQAEAREGNRRRRGGRGRGRGAEGEGSDANAQTQGAELSETTEVGNATERHEDSGRGRRGRGERGERNRRGEREERIQQTTEGEASPADSGLTLALPVADNIGTGPFSLAPAPAAAEPAAAQAPSEASVVVAEAAPAAVQSPAPAPLAVVVEAAPAIPTPAALVAAPFVLPMADLSALAQQAGLEWVNSDAGKISAVQEAIAAEPKPVHVPRERKPPVVLDEGPLVLVETRKDLSQVKLPFEDLT